MIGYVGPKIINVTNEACHVLIKLRRRTKNHVNIMYFGAQSVGADFCIGLLAMHHIDQSPKKMTVLFTDFKISFLKPIKSDAHFHCIEGNVIKELIDSVLKTGQRQSKLINGFATTPDISGDEPVSQFSLTLTVK